MIWQVQLDPAMYAASVHARRPRRLGHRVPLRHPQHRLHPAKQRKVMGLLESLAEATAIMSGELRDTEPTPVHFFIVPCRASVARLMATYLAVFHRGLTFVPDSIPQKRRESEQGKPH